MFPKPSFNKHVCIKQSLPNRGKFCVLCVAVKYKIWLLGLIYNDHKKISSHPVFMGGCPR